MTKGTAPLHTFTIPFDTELIDKVRILYAQNGVLVLKKTEADCTLEGNVIKTKLTQEDTFKFSNNYSVAIQLRLKLHDGEPLISEPEIVAIEKCFDDEVL